MERGRRCRIRIRRRVCETFNVPDSSQPIPREPRPTLPRAGYVTASLLSGLLLAASILGRLPEELGGTLEVVAVLTGAWSVWYLARNRVVGWWIAGLRR